MAKVTRQNGRACPQGKGRKARRALYRAVSAVLLSRFDWEHLTCPSYQIPIQWLPVAGLRLRAAEARPMSLLAEVRGPVVRHAEVSRA